MDRSSAVGEPAIEAVVVKLLEAVEAHVDVQEIRPPLNGGPKQVQEGQCLTQLAMLNVVAFLADSYEVGSEMRVIRSLEKPDGQQVVNMLRHRTVAAFTDAVSATHRIGPCLGP